MKNSLLFLVLALFLSGCDVPEFESKTDLGRTRNVSVSASGSFRVETDAGIYLISPNFAVAVGENATIEKWHTGDKIQYYWVQGNSKMPIDTYTVLAQ